MSRRAPPAFHGPRPLEAGAAALSLSAVYLPRCWSGESRPGASWKRLFPKKPSLTPFPARPSYLPIDSGCALADGLTSCFGNLLASPSPLVSMPFSLLLSSRGPGTSKPCQTMPNTSPISSLFELRFALVVCKHSCCCCSIFFSFIFPFMLQNIC